MIRTGVAEGPDPGDGARAALAWMTWPRNIAEAYDKLVAETIEVSKTGKPGPLVYASHTVERQPPPGSARTVRSLCTPT